MDDTSNNDPKALFQQWRDGDLAARDTLFNLLYSELGQISAALLRAERNASLAAGDLVNEAVIRLIQLERIDWQDKAHFLALSARAMRRVLIDHARRKNADRRQHQKVTLITSVGNGAPQRLELDALDKALIRLAVIDKQRAEIVELRYFGGLTLDEVADVLGISPATVKRSWRAARAWLLDAMEPPGASVAH